LDSIINKLHFDSSEDHGFNFIKHVRKTGVHAGEVPEWFKWLIDQVRLSFNKEQIETPQ